MRLIARPLQTELWPALFFAMTTVSQPVFGLQFETYTQNAHIKYFQGWLRFIARLPQENTYKHHTDWQLI